MFRLFFVTGFCGTMKRHWRRSVQEYHLDRLLEYKEHKEATKSTTLCTSWFIMFFVLLIAK